MSDDDALWHAAEHGLSFMIGQRMQENGVEGPRRLYHRCKDCEEVLRLLQQRGIYTDVSISKDME